MIFSGGAVLDGRVDGASTACKRGIRVRRFAKACARARGAKQGLKQVCNTIKKTLRRAACFFFDVVAPALLTVKPGPWCASGVGWRRSSWRPWGGTCVLIPVLRGGRADAGARREEAAARRARLGEARRPRMPAEPRRPAALPSEPAREARRRRPHSLDAGLVPDRGRDEAQRGEPRGGEGRGAHRNLGRIAAAAVRHGRPRRRRRGLCCRCARRLVRVAPRAVEAGGDQNAA